MKIREHSWYPDTAEEAAEDAAAEYAADVQAEAAQTTAHLREDGLLAGTQDEAQPLTPAEEAEFDRELAVDSGHGFDRADPRRPRYPE